MLRSNKDEVFVRQALEQSDYACGRWIANQRLFDEPPDSELAPQAKAAIVTAVAIYVETARVDRKEIQSALDIKTVNDAQSLVDRLHPMAFGGGRDVR